MSQGVEHAVLPYTEHAHTSLQSVGLRLLCHTAIAVAAQVPPSTAEISEQHGAPLCCTLLPPLLDRLLFLLLCIGCMQLWHLPHIVHATHIVATSSTHATSSTAKVTIIVLLLQLLLPSSCLPSLPPFPLLAFLLLVHLYSFCSCCI